MGWTVGKPKLGPWQGRKLCCQGAFEFFDHTLVWEGQEGYATLDDALHDLEAGLAAWMQE